jgi:hypothetical protein
LQTPANGIQQQQQQQGLLEEQGRAQQPARVSAMPQAALLLGRLTQATINIHGVMGAYSSPLWRALWRAMPALQRLNLKWPLELDGSDGHPQQARWQCQPCDQGLLLAGTWHTHLPSN